MAVFNGSAYFDFTDTSEWTWQASSTNTGYIVFYIKPIFTDAGFAFALSLDAFGTGSSVNLFFRNDDSGDFMCRVSGNSIGYVEGAMLEDEWNCVELLYKSNGDCTLSVNGVEATGFISLLPDDSYNPSAIRMGWTVNDAFEPLPNGTKICDFWKCYGADATPGSGTRDDLQAFAVDPNDVLDDILIGARLRDDTSVLVGTTTITNTSVTFDSDAPFELGGSGQSVTVGLLAPATTAAPTVSPGAVSITPSLLAPNAQHAPAVSSNVTVSPGLLTSSVLLSPSLVQAIAPALLSTAALHEPSLTGGAVTIGPSLLAPATMAAPSLSTGSTNLDMDFLAAAAMLQPGVSVSIAVPLLTSGARYEPTLTTGPTSIVVPLLEGAAAPYPPRVRDPLLPLGNTPITLTMGW